jgi:hypothetical protein
MNIKNKKIMHSTVIFMFLLANILSFNTVLAYSFPVSLNGWSGNVSVPESTVSQMVTNSAADIEDRYGFNEDVWRNAQKKEDAPKVEIFFDNTNPKVGEKVTATAVPEFFKNDSQNLYYTWYIIHTKDGRPQTATNSIREGKIEAAKIMSHGDYDPDLDGQAYSSSGDPDADGWPSVDSNSYDEDDSAAPFGGKDGTGSQCYAHDFGTNDTGNTTDSSGTDSSVSCDHKWTNASGYTSGSGKFPTGEEEYWKTDPTDPDTDGDGFNDEADVVGLGQTTFTWNYQTGDRVGIVVEGTSMIPIDQDSAYYKIMWGYPDVCDSSKAGLLDSDQCGDSGDYGYGFLATQSPSEQSTGDKLKVSLSYTPDNPIADPSNENKANILTDGTITDADTITVSSSLDNTDYDPEDLYYTWQISKSTDMSSDTWKEVSNLDSNFSLSTATSGLGVTDLTFSPKKNVLGDDANIIYFKVTLTLSESSGVKTNRGRSSVIIPVNKNGLKISLYKVNVSNGIASVGDEVCTSGLYKTMCPAAHNQMLAAKITSSKYLANTDFAWSLDGETYSITGDAQNYFTGLNGYTIIFPVTKDEGETEDVSVTATPKSDLAPVTGSRTITVVTPAVFINSDDEDISWQHTYTTDSQTTADTTEEVSSSDVFDVLTNDIPSYRVSFLPDYFLDNDSNVKIDWLMNNVSIFDTSFYETNPLDGGSATLSDSDKVFSFPTSETTGTYYTLGASIKKYWSADEKSILSTVWGITPETLSADTTITIGTVDSKLTAAAATQNNNPNQMLAAIGTHLPHYLMYNLRLALTILVMFFLSAGFYALSQSFGFNEDR